MIKIDTTRLDVKKYHDYVKRYMDDRSTKYNFDDINNDLKNLFELELYEIMSLNPKEIRVYIDNFKDVTFSTNIESLRSFYNIFRDEWGTEFLYDLNIKVCPFCNREYVFTFEDNIQEKTRMLASLDHYYDKDRYPFLSISLYNLIPCCHICNSKFKHSQNFYKDKHLHPYEDSFNDKAKFTQFFKNVENETINKPILSKERISLSLELVEKYDIKTKNTINTFRLETLYQEHKDIVLELIQKREIYPDSYIDDLFHHYEGTLFKNREDVLRHITGGYMEDKDIDKRPLSKLIKDISEELDLI